ncbi:MAG: Nramp family divalent metal transporter [Dehalococcoidales bacterium]|nr:Nramp family divalent metal transporter [Dehalococcoidales bacterium]
MTKKKLPDEATETLQIGVSRPALKIADIPTPEQVFNLPKIGPKETITAILGPSLIALGISIGSGEWLLGPMGFSKYGFIGLGFLVMISAILQTFYNIENARYTVATGEVPAVGFARTPPGQKFWIPFTLFILYLGMIWGGYATAVGQSIFAVFTGRTFDPGNLAEYEIVRGIAVLMLFFSLLIFLFGKKISRTMEIVQGTTVFLVLIGLAILVGVFVPMDVWARLLKGFITPAMPPHGIDANTLGAIIGYTGAASGLNFMMINYYRDKGYGMGHLTGFISGLFRGQKKEVLPSGITFRESAANNRTWKRWFRFLLLDQWAVFFVGSMAGMILCSTLVVSLTLLPGAGQPTAANMPVYAATELSKTVPWLFPVILIMGALILWTSQATTLEMLIRNTTDSFMAISPRLRDWISGDPRKCYYIVAVGIIILISIFIHLALPVKLLQYSANMANLAAMIYPLVLIYLNRKLPRPARSGWWAHILLGANVIFFGFFFVNFASFQITGQALVKF